MKINVSFDVNVDARLGDDLTIDQIKSEILDYLKELLSDPTEEFFDFGSINVPSNNCWDCYTNITIKDVEIL